MMLIGLIVGLPIFLHVGFMLLIPLAFIMTQRYDTTLPRFVLPLRVTLSVAHAMVPPLRQPRLHFQSCNDNIRQTILWGIRVGIPIAIHRRPASPHRAPESKAKTHAAHRTRTARFRKTCPRSP